MPPESVTVTVSSAANPYTVLNLRKPATDEEIKQAYFEMVKKWDPERHTDRFMVIQQAYDKLRDPKKRAKEDLFTYNFVKGEFAFTPEEKTGPPDTELIERLRDAEVRLHAGGAEANGARDEAVELLLTSSYRNFRKKLWAEAIRDLARALEIDPTHQRAKNNINLARMRLGWSYVQSNLIKEAIQEWEQSLQLNADNTLVIHNLAIAAEADGERESAERYWSETLRRWKQQLEEDPENEYIKALIIETHKHFGGRSLEAARREGGASAVIEEYKEVLKINPNDFEAQIKIAETLMENKSWPEAVKELRALSSKFPTNIQVLNLHAWAQLNGGDIDSAFATWQRCIKLDPKNYAIRESVIKARLDLGKKHRESHQYTPALVHFKALLKMLPQSPEVHKEIAKTYQMQGDKPSAYRHWTLVTHLDPKDRDAKRAISELRMRTA
jgi:tetratricopeptide (TPR) repeat protein